MLSLIYVSSSVGKFSEAGLVAMLEQCRDKNARLDITGMLLYKDGNFIQVLEGPDDAVRQLFQTISDDGRHHGVIRLMERQIEQREFADWTMGFRNLNDESLRDIPGYGEFMNEQLDSQTFQARPSFALQLLQVFRSNMSR